MNKYLPANCFIQKLDVKPAFSRYTISPPNIEEVCTVNSAKWTSTWQNDPVFKRLHLDDLTLWWREKM